VPSCHDGKKVPSDKYEKLKGVMKGNVNECRVNELKCCFKGRKHRYDRKHCHDASFYPFNDSRILACPATHSSNSLDGWELGTKNGR